MLTWGAKQLETVLGKTVTGIIGVFLLGAGVMWAIPKYIVTTDIFKQKVEDIYNEIKHGDKWQELSVIKCEKEYWEDERWKLESKIDDQHKPATTSQKNRMGMINKKLEKLEDRREKLSADLKNN
jgi:predicted RNase H-like nuclease (RuvC/YqgF family)